ncbi:radical SAM family heme chaperone HemW [Pontivivens insulae]|uniref:Heme chaperone HemW n=1 Tax=Pontivivens insulae TaxID=1639689 RepID=A0A2R8A7N4_9RHOB|nr:radical SAM family heme chaperone HemW [Pontivivens insulae]RED18343.1 oxygen-independent coproporphyrinogen-3 oxidase [Pontivivens insulae]SPF28241.1 Oxygen-independent coproporphyrinogen-III oxidase-like protein YqeR [Pontivivens insulae]
MPDWEYGGFGVYVHWPFCLAKCPYCDFNSHVRRKVDQSVWRRALVAEIARTAAETPGRTVDTVFFGGGTPSLMEPETVTACIDAIAQHWTIADNAEISLEANPTSVEAERFRGFRDAGVNRISMGIQSLRDSDLKRLGRMHSVAEAKAAFNTARALFDRVSFDLIYARQDQTLQDWEAELSEALSMAVDHLSLYQLTIEDGTRFGDLHARGNLRGLPTDALAADFYDLTQELTSDAGLNAYEISNHARPRAESRHNRLYWRYGDYAGIGPGAHGRLTHGTQRFATATWRNPERWLKSALAGSGETDREALTDQDAATELALMSLRLIEGLSLQRFEALNGAPFDADVLDRLSKDGLIKVDDNIRLTAAGRPLTNAILRELLA